jgi:6-phosphofructokinase 2
MNPAVDIATGVDKIVPEHKLRCDEPRIDAGGGGINVARALKRLGGPALAIFPAGGATGQLLEGLLRSEGVPFRSIPIAGETRESFSVRETSSTNQFRFVLPGPLLSAKEIDVCLMKLDEAIAPSSFVVASGSLPRGVPDDFYRSIAEIVLRRGARFVLDCSGAPLKTALGSGVHLVKPSRRELGMLVGRDLLDQNSCLAACRNIVDAGGAEYVAVTLGAEGAMLLGPGVTLRASAPSVASAISSVGAGDSFLGALVWSLASRRGFGEALRLAVAAGSASLLTPGTGLFKTEDLAAFCREVAVEEA